MAVTPFLPRTLKFRMTVVVVLLVLAATVTVASLALMLAERDMKSVIGDQQYALLSSAAAHIDSQLTAKRTLLATLADSMPPDLIADPRKLQAFLEQYPSARKEFLNLLVFDRLGTLRITTAAGIATVVQDPARLPFYRQALGARRSLISPPFHSPVSKVPVVLITQPVLDPGGRIVMVLAGSIDLAHAPFLEQIAAQKPGKTGFMFIMTAQGILVHHPNKARVLEHINARPGRNAATEKALNGFEGWTEATNKDGSEGIYAYKRLLSTDWVVGARFPVDEAFAPMIEMRHQAVVAAAVVAAVAGLVAWLVILILLRPLERLRNHVNNIRHGRSEIGVLLRRRRDEIGQLSCAFHVLMAEREEAQERTRDSEQRLIQLARIDTLTGIANRLKFDETVLQAMGRSRRNRQPMALAYLDIDNFKAINDTLGHGAGDSVLQHFAMRLAESVRTTDTVARLAGDEFVIIFEQVHNRDEAARLAAKIVDAVRRPMTIAGKPMAITTSIGVALHGHGDDEDPVELVARADRALYAAKRNGRDGHALADERA
jgi:diguanylate cyclase (GGDEF)-like protein